MTYDFNDPLNSAPARYDHLTLICGFLPQSTQTISDARLHFNNELWDALNDFDVLPRGRVHLGGDFGKRVP